MFRKRMISVESAKKPMKFNWPVGPVNVLILLIRPPKNFTGPLHSKIRYISSVGDFLVAFPGTASSLYFNFSEAAIVRP